MKLLWLGCLALLGGCYSPDLSGVRYTCDEANPYCPDGLFCLSGVCQKQSGMVSDAGAGGGLPDGVMSAPGCRLGMGYTVGSAFACPSEFSSNAADSIPAASQLCATGYQLCSMAAVIDLAACRKLSGFFAAQVPMRRGNSLDPKTFVCGATSGQMQMPLFAGCGRQTKDDVYDVAQQACGGFTQALDCFQDPKWFCKSTNLDGVDQQNSFDGVLCCRG